MSTYLSPRSSYLGQCNSAVLWRAELPQSLGAAAYGNRVFKAPIALAAVGYQEDALGFDWPSPAEALERVDQAMRAAGGMLSDLREGVIERSVANVTAARGQLAQAGKSLQDAYWAFLKRGATESAEIVAILARRVASAGRELGSMIGDFLGNAFRAFWGFGPGWFIAGAFVLIAASMGMAYMLFATGALQPLLMEAVRTVPKAMIPVSEAIRAVPATARALTPYGG